MSEAGSEGHRNYRCDGCGKEFKLSWYLSKKTKRGEKVCCSKECSPVKLNICRECGNTFSHKTERDTSSILYCSLKCKAAYETKALMLKAPQYKCEACGNSFVLSKNNKDKRFCSMECRSNWLTHECGFCGKTFTLSAAVASRKRKGHNKFFCSRECGYKWYHLPKELICGYCHKPFMSTSKNRVKYCSKECRTLSQTIYDKREMSVCKQCGKRFYLSAGQQGGCIKKDFCSRECFNSSRTVSFKCEVCGKNVIQAKSNYLKTQKHVCSPECLATLSSTIAMTCAYCKKPYNVIKSRKKNTSSYCSKQCYDKSRRIVFNCEVCNKETSLPINKYKQQGKHHVCSANCRTLLIKANKVLKKCKHCGKSFDPSDCGRDTASVSFCCDDCIARKITQSKGWNREICQNCGKSYSEYNTKKRKVRVCSSRCEKALTQPQTEKLLASAKCVVCGAVFGISSPPRDTRSKLCCSVKCQSIAKEKALADKELKMMHICEYCGKTFKTQHSETRYCSKSCAKQSKPKLEKKCAICGKTFNPSITRKTIRSMAYCSSECKEQSKKQHTNIRTCRYCGAMFTAKAYTQKSYCSYSCMHEGKKYAGQHEKAIVDEFIEKGISYADLAKKYGGNVGSITSTIDRADITKMISSNKTSDVMEDFTNTLLSLSDISNKNRVPIGIAKKITRGHRRNLSKNNSGYIERFAPDHPFAAKNGKVLEHRWVVEGSLKRYLGKKEIVHHINFVKTDNRLENLVLIDDSYHKRIPRSVNMALSPLVEMKVMQFSGDALFLYIVDQSWLDWYVKNNFMPTSNNKYAHINRDGRRSRDRPYLPYVCGIDKEMRKDSGFVHRIEAAKMVERNLLRGEQVHHINFNKDDNRHENLVILPDKTSHARCHASVITCLPPLIENNIIRFDQNKLEYFVYQEWLDWYDSIGRLEYQTWRDNYALAV